MIKRQILLPKSSFALANDEDVFINLQLSKTFSDLKNEVIDNVFNINQQYNTERQNSLKFCIYGLVESIFDNSGNLIIDVKDSTDLTLNLPKISSNSISEKSLSIRTFELTLNSNGMSRNLYGNTKSAYSFLFEIDRNELNAQNALIISNGGLPVTRSIEFKVIDTDRNIFYITNVPYLFYDLEGNPVKFGSQTADVDENGNVIDINNDFPFLYDRHWIIQRFNLPAPSFSFFTDTTVNVLEKVVGEKQISSSLSARTIQLDISLDQPSPYGLEEVDVILDHDNTKGSLNQDFIFYPQTITWNVGEQIKTFNADILDNGLVQNDKVLAFKTANLKFCVPQSGLTSNMTVNISDNNSPSQIRFVSGNTTVKRSISAITIDYVFDKPIEVEGQSITLFSTTNSTAVLGQDFILDKNNPNATELIVFFNKGEASGSTTISILDTDKYNVDLILELAFKNQTQNISLSNVGAVPNIGPVFRTTIQDSVVTQFSFFILINNPNKKIGAVKSFNSPDENNRYSWNNDPVIGFGIATQYDIVVRNLGDDVVFSNQLIKSNSIVTTISITGQQTTDTVIDLPSNVSYDKPNKKYDKSKYEFLFVSKEKFKTNESPQFGYTFVQDKEFESIPVDVEKNAGPSGSSKYYLTTKLLNFYLNFDKPSQTCTTFPINIVDFAYTNNLVFKGFNPFGGGGGVFVGNTSISQSSIEVTFEDSITPSFCSQFLPFGFDKLPKPPYTFNYVNINFRNVYPQSTTPLGSENNYLKLDSAADANKRGFLRWNQSSLDTRHAMILSVLNNGDIPVDISGNTVSPGEKIMIRGFQQELDNLSITLPTNESFVKSKSGFTFANYILSVDNIVYFSQNGQASGSPETFVFDSTNTLASGPLSATPKYYVVAEYSQMFVPFNATDDTKLDCGSMNFTSFGHLGITDLAVRGLLLPSSASGFRRGYFVDSNNDLLLTCTNQNNVRIPFKQL